MVVQYKCPNCGADMAFDSTTGMLHCDSCGTNENIENMPKQDGSWQNNHEGHQHSHSSGEEENTSWNTKDTSYSHHFGEDDVKEYHCKNCGAVLITDKDTTATTCSFCGAGVVLGDRLTGNLAPAKVIPFSINKEQAKDAFVKWCKKGLLTPKGFMTADRIKNITGLYVPFWLYDLNGRGEANATCTRVRTYEQGDYIYTETKYYNIYRNVDLNYLKVPVDASAKMNDELMDKLEPYNYSNLKMFNMPYLAGYIAEKYNYDNRQLFPRVRQRVEPYVNNFIDSTIRGYTSTTYHNKNINLREIQADYVLLPVWMVCYDYKKSDHIFAMNGQTGKIVGKPPLSIGKIAAWFGGISGAAFIVMQLISLVSGGF